MISKCQHQIPDCGRQISVWAQQADSLLDLHPYSDSSTLERTDVKGRESRVCALGDSTGNTQT